MSVTTTGEAVADQAKSQPIRLLLVDDHTILRQGLRRLFEVDGEFQVVGEAKNGREAVDLARDLKPDVIIMDLAMPALNGLDATRRILKAEPGAKVLVLSMYIDDDYVTQALDIGVSGYLLKDAPARELLGAVRTIAKGETHFTPRIPAATVERYRAARVGNGRRGPVDLTHREREVLKLLAEGHTVRAVAEVLHLSQKTVDTHKTNLMRKLGLHNRVELVKYAIQNKLIRV